MGETNIGDILFSSGSVLLVKQNMGGALFLLGLFLLFAKKLGYKLEQVGLMEFALFLDLF